LIVTASWPEKNLQQKDTRKEGGKMNKRFLGLGMLSAFLLAAPVLAQNVDQKIQALEQELLQLKEQQIELKKERQPPCRISVIVRVTA
jgi:hypothetical protein